MTQNLITRLTKLDAPDREVEHNANIAATKQKIRDAFAGLKPCIALLRAKEASKP
ncbi:hypothetical protein [Brucella intermedia]|uniref:hypothetical protein n=1 Tax=Brucella intermedia TaxID=94625 RepID=UPI00244701E9|nr:hypothetical protein [Brucella intermedia]WGG61898.1 hypothetical protein QA414_15375 [Brucella intermedia]